MTSNSEIWGADLDRQKVQWIAVDWGASNLRAYAMDEVSVLADAQSDADMYGLSPDRFEGTLLSLIADWLPDGRQVPVIACGMVCARHGWQEAGYRKVPCAPVSAQGLVRVHANDPRLAVFWVPGLSQDNPADVMRGEECQIAGALALHREFDGVFCLAGTHSKWAHISAGEVVSFQSFMTGEMFAILAQHSVLRHGLSATAWDDDAFDQGVSDGLSRPERLAARLFSIRAEGLLNDLNAGAARARLSGLLIGAEIAASKPYWLGQNLIVIGKEKPASIYARALASVGLSPKILSGEACRLAGLSVVAQSLILRKT